MDINSIIAAALVLSAVGIPATEAIKRAIDTVSDHALDVNRFAPVISIVVCVALAFSVPVDALPSVATKLGAGIISGLMACGAWSATKATVLGK